MAELLRAQRGADLPRVISSPRVRAQETATIVRSALGPAKATVELDERLGGEQPIPWELVSALATGGADALLVGHQPAVEELCRGLIRPEPLMISGFRTATIVALASDGVGFRVASILDSRDAGA
jgi:phosphohistidine phosphatase